MSFLEHVVSASGLMVSETTIAKIEAMAKQMTGPEFRAVVEQARKAAENAPQKPKKRRARQSSRLKKEAYQDFSDT